MSTVDVQAEAETSAIIEFERSKADWILVAYFVLGVIAIGYFLSRGGLVVGLFGCLLFRAAYGRAITIPERKVDLAFDHEGLSVPTVFEQKLPWGAITGFALEHGHEGGLELYVEVIEPKSYGPRSRLSLTAWPVFSRGFRLALDSIACSDVGVEAAFRRFAPHARKV
ncbi:hypothetical protein LJR090_000573 [Bosea sp. LjRoot90]|uniref:hypothetical protein n=1 Tax=Bosea sp. LjRoot90 TaxID=3342342 RepID=UPI003ED02D97